MLRAVTGLLYSSSPANFASDLSVAEAVRRLSAATTRSIFSAFTREAAVGTVEESRVSLQRSIPLLHNSFKPIFVGAFHPSLNGAKLIGVFRMHRSVQIFMTVWFGFCIFWTVAATLDELTAATPGGFFPLFGVGMLAFGVALVHFGKWLSRNDPAWLAAVIQKALSTRAA
jgi:hypothetical protein